MWNTWSSLKTIPLTDLRTCINNTKLQQYLQLILCANTYSSSVFKNMTKLQKSTCWVKIYLNVNFTIASLVKIIVYTTMGNLLHNLQIQSHPVLGLCNSIHQCFLVGFSDPQKVPGKKGEYLLPGVVLSMVKDMHLQREKQIK